MITVWRMTGRRGSRPEGWLPDRVSVGALTRAFPPELVDRIVATTDTRELRRRLLPARLVVYFVLALWLFRGPNCGYGRVMIKLVDALYHRRRGQALLDGTLDHLTETFFAGLQVVPAACAFHVDRGGRQRTWRYWSIPQEPRGAVGEVSDPPASYAELFEDAVRIRLRSDVPLGICLSGGLDSTAVICAMAFGTLSISPICTYHHPAFDERRYVDATVNRTGARVHWLEMDHVALWDLAEPVMRAHDEPVHTLTAMVGYELMRMIAGCGIKVILNGQGADETLGGYDSYFPAAWYSDLRRGRPWQALSEIRRYTSVHGGVSWERMVGVMEHLVKTELRRSA